MKRILLAAALAAICITPAAAQQLGYNTQGTMLRAAPNGEAHQTAVATAATQVATQRDTRQEVVVSIGAANNCAIGFTSAVTLATGFKLQPVAGASVPIRSKSQVYMICDAATTVSVLDAF